MEKGKVSFGFNKLSRKSNLLPIKQTKREENKVELIKCLEGQQIKLMEEKKEEAPLVIPLVSNQRTSTALASLLKRRAVLLGEDENEDSEEKFAKNSTSTVGDTAIIHGDDLEKRAALELLAEMKSQNEPTEKSEQLVVPVVKPDDLPLDGAKQSTLDDYETIPIQQFGFAMLRGMGWVEPPKKVKSNAPDMGPVVRPKGMGLGADKALKAKPLLIPPESNEVLEIRKQAYVRILGGKFKDLYGQIQGFDDHAGRIIVKMAIGGTQEAFNEFLCQPVSKKEFGEYGRCINTDEYKKLKELENANGQITLKKEIKDPSYTKRENTKDRIDILRKEETKIKIDRTKSDLKLKVEKYENDRQHSRADRHYKSHSSRKSRSPEPRYRSREANSCSELRQNIRKKFELTDDSSKSEDSFTKYKDTADKKLRSEAKRSDIKKKSHRKNSSPFSDNTSASSDCEYLSVRHRQRSHNKKSKKSKRARSRSRSRGRR